MKTEIEFLGLKTEIYLYGLRLFEIVFDVSKNKLVINGKKEILGKTIKKLIKKGKGKPRKYKVSPRIIKYLGLKFFINQKSDSEASDWAMRNAFFKTFPERLKVSSIKEEKSSITFSIYGFLTIFQIFFGIITNTKRR